MRGSRWLQGEHTDEVGKEDTQKGQLQPAQGALSTGRCVEAFSVQGFYLVAPLASGGA